MAVVSDKVRQAFRSWDANGHGLIARSELTSIIQRLNPGIGDGDLEALFAAAGVHCSSRVDYDNFINWLWSDCGLSDSEIRAEAARERGLWEGAIVAARAEAATKFPPERVNRYFDEVYSRLIGADYIAHVKGTFFEKVDRDRDGRVSFSEAAALISKSLQCAADLGHGVRPSQEEVRAAFDAHDTLIEGRGRMGVDEFLNLARYLQVRVAEAMLPLSQVVRDG